jgi:TetR/AcrR family transcriptional regulator, transcriptional repressor for nem operon
VKTSRSQTRQPVSATTRERILDVAEALVQTRGFNAFSYADVAAELEITKASLHHHFATKADLGKRLIERYHQRFVAALQDIQESGGDARRKLEHYARLYADVLRRDRMCLCGMLAADIATLPLPIRGELQAFFDANERWLASVIEQARDRGMLRATGTSDDLARVLVSSLEGAMLVARSYGDPDRFDVTAARLFDAMLEPGAAKKRSPSRTRAR